MNIDPAEKMITKDKIEKYILRKAFDTSDDPSAQPYLPEKILWRQKEQFSDGVGYSWIGPAVDVDHDGEDVRDTLKIVTDLALRGICIPTVEKVVPFERAPMEAFGGESATDGRPVVVKVVG